ncbi:Protein RTA1 [Fusarium oxysporum f. sp. albedinis]|nr:Protein RTA1 [Fusarium oxysporum f. sp. albedinis]
MKTRRESQDKPVCEPWAFTGCLTAPRTCSSRRVRHQKIESRDNIIHPFPQDLIILLYALIKFSPNYNQVERCIT